MIKWFLNLLGRDSIFDIRPKKVVGPWVVVGLGAGDWVKMRDLIQVAVFDNQDTESRYHSYMGYQMRAIALSVRSKWGFPLFDPDDSDELVKIAAYPQSLLEEALEAVADLSGMDWLKPVEPSEQKEPTDTPVVKKEPLPDELPEGAVPEDFDDGLDYSDEKEVVEVNPLKACVTDGSSTA